jgi:hypothetical protein
MTFPQVFKPVDPSQKSAFRIRYDVGKFAFTPLRILCIVEQVARVRGKEEGKRVREVLHAKMGYVTPLVWQI